MTKIEARQLTVSVIGVVVAIFSAWWAVHTFYHPNSGATATPAGDFLSGNKDSNLKVDRSAVGSHNIVQPVDVKLGLDKSDQGAQGQSAGARVEPVAAVAPVAVQGTGNVVKVSQDQRTISTTVSTTGAVVSGQNNNVANGANNGVIGNGNSGTTIINAR